MPPPPNHPANLLTPVEARTKRCHTAELSVASANGTIAGIVTSLGFGVDRDGLRALSADPEQDLPSKLVRCIADDCMAWRWFSNDEGFCGLAGEP